MNVSISFLDVFLSVLSGVLSAAVVAFIVIFIKRVIIPWFQTITYDGVRVVGEWHCIDPSMSQEIVLNLKQRSINLEGTATFVWDHEETDDVRTYEVIRSFNVRGIVRDRFVQLTLSNSNPDRFGMCCYLLEVCGDGRAMKGCFSFYGVIGGKIDCSTHTLFRDRQLAERIDGAKKAEGRELRKAYLERQLQHIHDEESGQLSLNDQDIPF